ncbi:DUF4238 domain-containing protein [Paraburkholderia sp. A3BS-1L]|uniref:DUF4238 domain-containing protein n=1 Tax=Paraburkholderia sp. A3BS-1L TaxID=3028375 RepID=UPI003DA84E4B
MKHENNHTHKKADPSSSNVPHNHHYVPQHFLKAWSVDSSGNKIHRYKWISATNKVEFKTGRSIELSASAHDLYTLSDSTVTREFETSIMTARLDTPGSEILQKIRVDSIGQLSAAERSAFAHYLVALEGRNPMVMEQMHLSAVVIDGIAAKLEQEHKAERGSFGPIAGILKKLKSTGALAAAAYVGGGSKEHARAILDRQWVELRTEPSRPFFTSNYPVGRCAWFDRDDFFACLAVSPTRAVFFVPKTQVWCATLTRPAGMRLAAQMLKMLTLRNASEAYTSDSARSVFITEELSWRRRKLSQEKNEKDYLVGAAVRYSKTDDGTYSTHW